MPKLLQRHELEGLPLKDDSMGLGFQILGLVFFGFGVWDLGFGVSLALELKDPSRVRSWSWVVMENQMPWQMAWTLGDLQAERERERAIYIYICLKG